MAEKQQNLRAGLQAEIEAKGVIALQSQWRGYRVRLHMHDFAYLVNKLRAEKIEIQKRLEAADEFMKKLHDLKVHHRGDKTPELKREIKQLDAGRDALLHDLYDIRAQHMKTKVEENSWRRKFNIHSF